MIRIVLSVLSLLLCLGAIILFNATSVDPKPEKTTMTKEAFEIQCAQSPQATLKEDLNYRYCVSNDRYYLFYMNKTTTEIIYPSITE